jgi:Domain of unknown function (DUF4010)/MgtC family
LVGRQRGAPRTDGHVARPMRAVPLSTSRYFRGVERMPGLRARENPDQARMANSEPLTPSQQALNRATSYLFLMVLAPAHVVSFAVALGAGLLIGIERERRKGAGADRALAGVRTFTLTSLAGALAQALQQPLLVAAGAVLTVVLIAIAYQRDQSTDPGVTTEVALFITFLIGVTTVDAPVFAGGAAVVVASLLAMRSRLHDFSTKVLTARELHDALLLAGAAMVILPLVPNAPAPWLSGANPRRLWGLVVLILALQGAGYIALRVAGARLGLALSGLASGFVSSTATVAAMGSRARTHPLLRPVCVAGAMFSSVATYLQLGLIALALHPPSLAVLAIPHSLHWSPREWACSDQPSQPMPPSDRGRRSIFLMRSSSPLC